MESLAKTGRKNGQERIGGRLVQGFLLSGLSSKFCLSLLSHATKALYVSSEVSNSQIQALGKLLPKSQTLSLLRGLSTSLAHEQTFQGLVAKL